MKFYLFLAILLIYMSANAQIYGCTDILASNFETTATINDGSCIYDATTISVDSSKILPSQIKETSGLILYHDSLLTHNDDSDTNLYLFSPNTPSDWITFPLSGISNSDWEDVDEDDNYIYVGDFGNNASGNRTNLKIYRISKATLENSPVIDTINFSYDDQIDFTPQGANTTDFDCEAFIVTSSKIYLFTKQWTSQKTAVYEIDKIPGTQTAEFKSEYNVEGLITGATHLEDSQLVVLTGYSTSLQPFIYLLYDFENNNFFSGNKRKIALNLSLHQIEGITTNDGINYILSNEKFVYNTYIVDPKIHFLNLSTYLSGYLNGDANLAVGNNESVHSSVMFPNPTTGIISISSPINMKTIELYDLQGKRLLSKDENIKTVDISYFKNGVYLMYLLSENGEVIVKRIEKME